MAPLRLRYRAWVQPCPHPPPQCCPALGLCSGSRRDGKGTRLLPRESSSLAVPCFGKASTALHCHALFLGISVSKAPFPFPLKLNLFSSLAGLGLGFLPALPGAGEGGPADREWLNTSSPPCCPPCCDRGAMAPCSATAGLARWAPSSPHTAMGPLGAVPCPSPFLQQGSGVVAVAGLGAWASPGLAAFGIKLFFQE